MNRTKDSDGNGWRVSVPATSANLGCAFDCGGLALKLYLNAFFLPGESRSLTLKYSGATPERIPLDNSNLVLRSLRFVAKDFGAPDPSGRVLVESQIPVG